MRHYSMRVMVSLNLADIMTAIHRTTPQHVYENNEADPADLNQELPTNSEQMKNTTELIE
jgi:hypothetical protein